MRLFPLSLVLAAGFVLALLIASAEAQAPDLFQSAPGPEVPKPRPHPRPPAAESQPAVVVPQPAPAPAAPTSIMTQHPDNKATFDGIWVGLRECAPSRDAQQAMYTVFFEIRENKIVSLNALPSGTPGYTDWQGTINPQGDFRITMHGISNGNPGAVQPRGEAIVDNYDAHFENGNLVATMISSRYCAFKLSRRR
jgi:hypothetical protein